MHDVVYIGEQLIGIKGEQLIEIKGEQINEHRNEPKNVYKIKKSNFLTKKVIRFKLIDYSYQLYLI